MLDKEKLLKSIVKASKYALLFCCVIFFIIFTSYMAIQFLGPKVGLPVLFIFYSWIVATHYFYTFD